MHDDYEDLQDKKLEQHEQKREDKNRRKALDKAISHASIHQKAEDEALTPDEIVENAETFYDFIIDEAIDDEQERLDNMP